MKFDKITIAKLCGFNPKKQCPACGEFVDEDKFIGKICQNCHKTERTAE